MSINTTIFTVRLTMCAVFASLAFFAAPLLAVDCTPDSITLSSQAEVDSFQADHGPGCDTIVTDLTVTGADITDLTPLSGLTYGGFGSEIIIDGTSVTSLAGLSGLIGVHRIVIDNNNALTNIVALSSLISVEGAFLLRGNPLLSNVNGLEGVTVTGGALWVANNASLTDINGLSNLRVIQASLIVDNNDALTNLNSLAGLEIVTASIGIRNNDALTDMSGLSGLIGFSDGLSIRNNSMLASIGNLPNLTDIGGLGIHNNDALINLDGLSGLATLGNSIISDNDALTNIDGLAGVVSAESDVEVTNNTSLSQCSGLKVLLDQVDDAQPGPGIAPIPDVGGDVTISGNLAGCNSIDEILGISPPPDTECPGAIFCDSFEGGGVLPTGQFSGTKWEDLDGNAQRDEDEPGLPGVTIYVDLNSNGALDQDEPSMVTDEVGNYAFTGVAAGTHFVREVVPDGFTQTFPSVGFHEVMLKSGEVIDGLHFGNLPPPTSDISGVKWEDLNGNAARDNDEPGLDGVTIYVDLNSNGGFDQDEPATETDLDGNYTLMDVEIGLIRVREVVPHGFVQTFPKDAYHEFLLETGNPAVDKDFGNIELRTGNIFGAKWNDLNGNAVPDNGETGLGGVTIYVDVNSNGTLDQGEPSSETGVDGNYALWDVEIGLIRVREVVPDGFVQTFPVTGYHEFQLEDGQSVNFLNFGNKQ